MSSLVKEDLAKRLFGPRRQSLREFIEVEGSGAERCYLCAAGTGAARPAGRVGAWACASGCARGGGPGRGWVRGAARARKGAGSGAGSGAERLQPRCRPQLRQRPSTARSPARCPRAASSLRKTARSPLCRSYGLELCSQGRPAALPRRPRQAFGTRQRCGRLSRF